MLILTSSVRHPGADGARERHQRDWTPSDSAGRLRVSYGHDLEAGWLLLATADTLRLPPAPLVHQARSAVRVMLDHGRDRRGGVCNSGPLRGRADDRQKIWWVQAECLVACLDQYARSGDEAARQAYLELLDWIATRQVDWVHGEWHHTIHPSGRVTGGKAGPWREPYHAGRAMLECLERLGRLGLPTSHGPIRR
jgi:mannobiose 2-epimerase